MWSRIGSVWVLACTMACYTWQAEPTPLEPEPAFHSNPVRLTLTDSSRLELFQPQIAQGTVRGWTPWDPTLHSRVELTVPLSQVYRVEGRHLSAARTVRLVLAVAASPFVVWWAIYVFRNHGCAAASGAGPLPC